MTEQLWTLGASELAARIRRKDVSSREVVEAHLRRIDAVNPRINAITVNLGESALDAADDADRALAAGEPVRPLHGVPMTVKENLDVTGSATSHGVTAFRDQLPRADSPHIAELRAAGAIPLGRTNLPDFGSRWHGADRSALAPSPPSGSDRADLTEPPSAEPETVRLWDTKVMPANYLKKLTIFVTLGPVGRPSSRLQSAQSLGVTKLP